MESKDYLARRSFQGGFVDVMGATAFGCLLTLAFASHINGAQKAALCTFAAIMPVLAMLRIRISELGTDPDRDNCAELQTTAWLLRAICVPLAVGMTLFIWGIWPLAAALALLSSMACVAVTYRKWKNRANGSNRDLQPSA